MKITINNACFNIDAEDLQSAEVEFSFWRGRRINIVCGTDLSIHQLRFNDIVQGILAEDAIFEEGEDKQKIYTALSKLKDEGYPYTGPLQIRIMLWFKQLFGNFYRQELLDQLENKLRETIEEPSSSEELDSSEISSFEGTDEELELPKSNICNSTFRDVLPILFTYVGRRWYRPLLTTCRLFHKVITTTTHLDLKTMHRDFHLLKRCFNLDASQQSRNEIFLLLHEFNVKEIIKKVKSYQKSGFYNLFNKDLPDIGRRLLEGMEREWEKVYKRRYLEYAIALAKIDAKSALKIVTTIVKPDMEWDLRALAFCAWATIHKNSTLCDKAAVLQMGKEIYKTCLEPGNPRFMGLVCLFEACLGLNNNLAAAILKDIKNDFINSEPSSNFYLQTTARMIKKCQPLEESINQEAVCLLSKTLELDFFAQAVNNENVAENLAIIAKTLILIDREKAILALDMAVKAVKNCSEIDKIKSLTLIAEAYNEFDPDRAFEVAKQAYDVIRANLYFNEEDGLFVRRYLSLEYLNRIVKIFATLNKEHASKVFYESMDKIHAELGIEGGKNEYYSNGFDDGFKDLFVETLEVFVLLDPEGAHKTVKRCIKWAKTVKVPEGHLLALGNALAKYFPDEALEIADLLENTNFKYQVMMSVVKESIDSKIARSYVERTQNL